MQLSSLHKGLIGHWPLDEQSFNPATKRFTDRSAYENHGTGNGTQLGSATPGFQADRMGQLVRATPFNGSDDYINITDVANDISVNQGTITIWLNTNADLGYIFQSSHNIRTYILCGTNKFKVIKGNPAIEIELPTIVHGVWYHVVLTWDYLTMKGYQDGILIDTKAFTNVTDSVISYIGCHSGSVNFFNGDMADFRIYNRVLSQQEITFLYESYRSKVVT